MSAIPLALDPIAVAAQAAALCSAEGGAMDRQGEVPEALLARLERLGLAALPAERWMDGDAAEMLAALTLIGSGDLSFGRLYEGHVNALLLIHRFGTRALWRRAVSAVRGGGLLGVWNTDSDPRLSLRRDGVRWRLAGGKSFASGAGRLHTALVTAWLPDETRQMVLVPMQGLEARIDRSSWRPLGMRASMSFMVDFSGIEIDEAVFLGAPGDYLAEPWFSAGCIRFAAVQLGGALALLRLTHAHLGAAGRERDPHQETRFARMWVALGGGRLWLDHVGTLFDGPAGSDPAVMIPAANMARHAITEACETAIDLSAKSIGVRGMMTPHPLERIMRDLTTYLRQPAPDQALASVGRAALAADRLPW